ncbi:MAG: UDP-N-acetylmuramoyl-tripeptide--D-alanyl-D-alanine ligase [Bacteroidetes bacterium]|nr:UDP-N-acetylmuramoyl-tripeptide--D-alanyl-D-alanine ligase [Bacteroidota bacterium]
MRKINSGNNQIKSIPTSIPNFTFTKNNFVQIADLYKIFQQFPSIQTDTRKVQKGDLFFALKGPNFNGNLFATDALNKGAAYAVVDEAQEDATGRLIFVEDVLTTLQDLAKYHRETFQIPFIAITGSNGKTTTKELVSTVLATHFKTATTEGNLNNHIGVPLTILKIKATTEIAVIEMGANHQKEIESYCKYTEPTHGIIANCGKAHLEGFGGVEGVRKGKGELYDYLRAHDGMAFLFNDYDYLIEMSKGIQKIFQYSTTDGNVVGTIESSEPYLSVALNKGFTPTTIDTSLVGEYNLPNVLCAVAVGKYFNVPEAKIVAALEKYQPTNSRSQLMHLGSNHIILDAYNANPTSMKAAIENFAKMQVTKKVLMLGGMMELGPESIQEHEAIVALIKSYQWDAVVLVGGDFAKIKMDFTYLNNSTEAREWYQQQGFENTYCLVKGSRSMQMEKIIQ